jgi:hypothetical protein
MAVTPRLEPPPGGIGWSLLAILFAPTAIRFSESLQSMPRPQIAALKTARMDIDSPESIAKQVKGIITELAPTSFGANHPPYRRRQKIVPFSS